MVRVAELLLLVLFGVNAISCLSHTNEIDLVVSYDFESLYSTIDNKDPEKDWWQTASFYQIYPRSFKDSNGDGIGDLNGITEKLQYLHDIGITATWLSPIFKSPMADFGYDISNFFDIQPEYGTLDDFDRMIERAKEIGIKIILDFVPNHSSDEHEWFRLSAKRDPHFEDFYIWHPGFVDPKNASGKLVPNNWVSVFGKSAWQFNVERQEFYLHQFSVKQPDLNYRNPKVVEMMKSILRFWLKRGVSGFRIDAVPFLFEVMPDRSGNYPDEPLSGNTKDPDNYGYLNHIFTQDMNETVDMVYQWRETLDTFKETNGGETRIALIEAYSSMEMVARYFGDATHKGAQLPFNFLFIERIRNDSNAYDYKSVIDDWMAHMPAGGTANWVIGNHDQHRVASRLGTDRIDIINMMLLTLPGASVNYNGEEIGMVDKWLSWNETVDPAACNTNPKDYENYSRDPERTPFQWDDTVSAGFSTNPHTWLPIGDNYKKINVKAELAAGKSHLLCYKELMKLRQTATLKNGEFTVKVVNDNVLIINRSLPGKTTYITMMNIGSDTEYVNMNMLAMVSEQMVYEVVGVSSAHTKGETVAADNIILKPKESFVLKSFPESRLNSPFFVYRT